MSTQLPYVFAFSATIIFSLSCIFYTVFSNRFSAFWVNTLKTSIACVGFAVVTTVFFSWNEVSMASLLTFFISGFAGLGIGDLFLLMAFTRIGAARTLIVFGFGPIFTGLIGFTLFGQTLSGSKTLAIFSLLACLFIFSYEGYKQNGKWEFQGVLFAIIGVFLDSLGIGFTRWGFEDSPTVLPLEANFYRALGALLFFFLFSFFRPLHFFDNLKTLTLREKVIVVTACISGTFLSLWLWNTAVKWGHLASISAIGVTGPFLATFFECLYYKRKPSKYILIAGVFFSAGIYILIG